METAASAVLRRRVARAVRVRLGGPLVPARVPTAEAALAVPPPQGTGAQYTRYGGGYRQPEVPVAQEQRVGVERRAVRHILVHLGVGELAAVLRRLTVVTGITSSHQ